MRNDVIHFESRDNRPFFFARYAQRMRSQEHFARLAPASAVTA